MRLQELTVGLFDVAGCRSVLRIESLGGSPVKGTRKWGTPAVASAQLLSGLGI